jgi:ferrous iron transport protein B
MLVPRWMRSPAAGVHTSDRCFFHPRHAGNLFSIYVIGILLALLMAWVFRKWLLRGESEPFVMELPVYRLPRLNSLLIQMWERAWLYLKKAGTIILAISILMWGAFTFPVGEDLSAADQMKQS